MAGQIAISAAVLLCCLHLSAGSTPKPASQNPYDSFVGTACRPPFGFRPNSCGAYETLTEVVSPAPSFVYGPNTCRFVRNLRVNEVDYEYRKYCNWVYDEKNYYGSWVMQCQLICQPTRVCSNRNQTIETSGVNCCPGFQTRPVAPKSHYNSYYQQHYTPLNTEPTGCPLAVGESIADCLRLQNLTRFLEFVEQSSYRDLINSNNSGITVFAPTNEAFNLVDPDLLSMTDIDMLVGNHIITGIVSESDLQHRTRIMNVIGLALHSTLIHFPDYSVITYQASSKHSSNSEVRFREMRFINGAGIENPDACKTLNGTLHIVNRVLMPGSETIANILVNDPQYSMFVEALMFAGTFNFLNESSSSHTVFAPTNDVFERDIPPELFNCLTSYMRVPLTNLILYHISKQTDYSQVLGLRQSAFSLFTDYNGPRSLLVLAAENGTLFLGELGDQIAVTTADIPASNGVIHEVGGVLMPQNFDYGKCQPFVPTIPPPTTPPPTTAAPTTMPTTALPTMEANMTVTNMAFPGNANNKEEDVDDYGLSDNNI